MRPAPILLLAAALAGCATLRGPNDAQLRYREGLAALARGDFAAASTPLEVASRSDDADLARDALMLLAVAELDPDNRGRSPEGALAIAERLRTASRPGSLEQLTAGTLERAAAEWRDMRADLADLTRERERAWVLIDSLQARIDLLTSQRDSVRRKAMQLEVFGDSLNTELKKKTQELDRIRRAIRG